MTASTDIPQARRFAGGAVLATGAASGIGAACVQRLLAEGACVAAAFLLPDDASFMTTAVIPVDGDQRAGLFPL